MSLSYEIHRCVGVDHHSICEGCRRREMGDPIQQNYIKPALDAQDHCDNHIPVPPPRPLRKSAGMPIQPIQPKR